MTTVSTSPTRDADLTGNDFGLTYDNLVRLDLRTGSLGVDHRHRDENGTPGAEYHGHVLTWAVPPLNAAAYEALLDDLTPHAQVLVDAYEPTWNGNNVVGCLTGRESDDVAAALAAIEDATTDLEEASSEWQCTDGLIGEINRACETAEQFMTEFNTGRGAGLGITTEHGEERVYFYRGDEELPITSARYFAAGVALSDHEIETGWDRAMEDLDEFLADEAEQ